MRFVDLEPRFLRHSGSNALRYIDDRAAADGVMFLCPACFVKNNGPRGTHSIVCWEPSTPQTVSPTGGRWPMTGNDFTDLSLTPSILIEGDCNAHFWIQNGEVTLTS